MAEWKKTHIHLKPVVGDPGLPDGFNLADQILIACQKRRNDIPLLQDWTLRQYSWDETDNMVMNVLNSGEGEVFCQFARFERDGLLSIADTKTQTAENLTISQISTPDGHDPCKSTSLLYVNGNYALMVDAGIRSTQIDRYLNWLLFDLWGEDLESLSISLASKFEMSDGKHALPEATEIQIQPKAINTPTPLENHIDRVKTAPIAGLTSREKILEILKIIGIGYEEFETIQNEAGGDALIEMGVNIKIRRKNKLVPINTIPLEQLARGFEDDAIKLRGKHGTVIGKMVSVKTPARITCKGSLFDAEDALVQMQAAWHHFLAQGYVSE